jgi:NDP-sugar pyrophosphorylase family protein
MTSAIIIAESGADSVVGRIAGNGSSQLQFESARPVPLGFHEILGRSVTQRLCDRLRAAGIGNISMACEESNPSNAGETDAMGLARIAKVVPDNQARSGDVLILGSDTYIDFNPAELLQYHREQGKSVTRAFDELGPLVLWVVDAERFPWSDDPDFLATGEVDTAYYRVEGYVNRLQSLRDLRTLATDALAGRGQLRPIGFEVRPGVWMAEDVEIEKSSRIVAPAFLGRGVSVSNQCLITRGSAIESGSCVDYGTIVEDSSILSNTYVGIGLDVSHSVVAGCTLFNLGRNVLLEISDPALMRPNVKDEAVFSRKDEFGARAGTQSQA